MEDRTRLLKEIEHIVAAKGLQPGDRLPAERRLAEEMLVSRNTLRGLLRSLEAQGLVTIKPGSGTYLRSCLTEAVSWRKTPLQEVGEQIEAAFMFLPQILHKALQTIDEARLKELQVCNIALGQAMCARNPQRVWSEISRFFRIIAQETGNLLVIKTVEQIFCQDHDFVDHIFTIDRTIREDIFAGHVNILQAMREKNASAISGLTRQYLLSLCRALESREDVSVWNKIPEKFYSETSHE